jgi:hypothetical protein
VLRGEGFQDDVVAEGLELGNGPLPLALGVAPDEVVATQVLVVAVVGEQVPGDHQDRVPDRDCGLPACRSVGPAANTGPKVGVTAARRRPGAPR